ncbi:reverse transcriptase domain-containing protein [Tanacetum coccineum]
MPPRTTTRSAVRATATPQGGRTGGRTGRGGGRTRGRSDITWWNSLIHTRSREAIVGMSWEDFKTLIREEFCLTNEMQKLETEFWNHAMVGAGHAAYTDRFHELARLVPYLVTPENKRIEKYIYGFAPQIQGMMAATEPVIIQRAVQKAGTLKDEAVRNGSLKKNPEKRGNYGQPNRDSNARDENKRTRAGNAFATTTNPVRRGYNGTIPMCVSCNLHHPFEMPCQACFNCGRPGHMAKDYRLAPRMVILVNARNPTAAPGACYECGGTNHFKAACPRSLKSLSLNLYAALQSCVATLMLKVEFIRISLIGFRSCTSQSLTGASQSRQHVDTSVIHIESRKPPTKSLLDVGSRRISIVTVNTKEYHSNVLVVITRIMRRTL